LHIALDYDKEFWEVLKILKGPPGAALREATFKTLNENPLLVIHHNIDLEERSTLVQV
jgi:hypothetical protein